MDPRGLYVLAAIAVATGLLGLGVQLGQATVPPIVAGNWIKLSVCSRARSDGDHEAVLARLGTSGELWLRGAVIVYAEDDPAAPGCTKVGGGQGKTFLVKGKADELVRLMP